MTVTIATSQRDVGAMMRYCVCGKAILRRGEKGHREREYCSDRCRQRACRARNKSKHDLDRLQKEASARYWTMIHQDVHRETWQDELEAQEKRINEQSDLISDLIDEVNFYRDATENLLTSIDFLNEQLAEKEVEIVRLSMLLDAQSMKRKRT